MNFRKAKLKQENKTSIIKTRELTENENPTPLQFDKFIPWRCLQMHISTLVTVERMTKEDCTLYKSRRVSDNTSRSRESIISSHYFDLTKIKDNANSISKLSKHNGANNAVNIKSYYNKRNQLIEIAIIDCPVGINRKVIQAINLCLPFHDLLQKFVIKGKGLTESVLNEIGKLLPYSNITDVCLDDTHLPEGKYYVLFESINHLQNLSLCRCKINDEVCKGIADNLNLKKPASKTLLTLDLTSNLITNLGASYLGLMLRTNRTLLYLNLSDNILGEVGVSHILQSLMLFLLTDDEVYDLRKRRFIYAAAKLEEYKTCEKELRDRMKTKEDKENYHTKPNKGRPSKFTPFFNEIMLKVQAEKKAKENIGEFSDIFDNNNVIYKNDKIHCIGNLKLCYLNLAHNDIKYSSIKKLCQVLKYQHSLNTSHNMGLLRVVIDGNNLPVADELFETIQLYLNKAIKKCLLLRELNRSHSYLGKKGQRKRGHRTS